MKAEAGFLVPVLDVGTIFEVKFQRVRAPIVSFDQLNLIFKPKLL